MPRYITARQISQQPTSGWEDEMPLLPAISVPDHFAQPTGILNTAGDELHRVPNPIGFTATID